MLRFATTCEEIAATTKKLLKTGIVADYLQSCVVEEAAVSAIFLSGRAFPAWEETTLQVGGRALWRIVEELAGKEEGALTTAYRKHGDLGAVAGEVLPARDGQGVGLLEVERTFREIAAARGPAAKAVIVRDLIARAKPLEAKYIVKIVTGDLRIGLKESLVEEAIARAYGGMQESGTQEEVGNDSVLSREAREARDPSLRLRNGSARDDNAVKQAKLNQSQDVLKQEELKKVQRANMLVGDLGETVRLAAAGELAEARMRMFHPLGFMLASPIESAEEGLSYFSEAAVEDKYDGIRAQAHVAGGEVKFFSRTRDEITESFPELPDALAGLAQDAILDGEILAWDYVAGRARAFSVLQQRLGRKKVSEKMLRETPVAYLAFDVLYVGGELVMDRPLRERAGILDELLAVKNLYHRGHRGTQRKGGQRRLTFGDEEETAIARVIRAPVFRAGAEEELEELFARAQERGNEGLMIKDLDSAYSPGKRGKAWLKMKRELATLDVVVTAVEYGHGKRVGVLSDYTFAVWDGDPNSNEARLVNIGKAYSGLTDVEIAEMTRWFLEHTMEDQGFRRVVEPKIVLEVAFNNMMESERHESGYALRFPRIVRLRPDKAAEEADTIERAREIFEGQSS